MIVVDTNVLAYLYLLAETESLMAGNEYEVASGRVRELVRDSDCSAYDCAFVALAMRLCVALVMMDAKLLRAFPIRWWRLLRGDRGKVRLSWTMRYRLTSRSSEKQSKFPSSSRR